MTPQTPDPDHYPPLPCRASPPQGGRSAPSRCVRLRAHPPTPLPTIPTPYPKPSPVFIPTVLPHAILHPLPLPDGSRTCWTRREEGLSGFAVTCGRSWKEAEAIGAPLAGGQNGRAKPATGPAPVFATPPWWPETQAPVRACGGHDAPSATRQGPCRTPKTTPEVGPDRGRSNPGGGNTPVVQGAACRMRTSSGETRAVRALRHPTTYSRGKARVRPSGHGSDPLASFRARGIWRGCGSRKRPLPNLAGARPVARPGKVGEGSLASLFHPNPASALAYDKGFS